MAKQKSNDGYNQGIYGALRTLMHFILVVQFSYGIYYDFTYVHFPPEMKRPGGEFGGKLKYLTVWDAVSIADMVCEKIGQLELEIGVKFASFIVVGWCHQSVWI